jgi:hypothetical protein
MKGYFEICSIEKCDGKVADVTGANKSLFTNVKLLTQYGYASNILINDNSMGLLMFLNGDRSNPRVIPFNQEVQPDLESSEVAIGNFNQGGKLIFKANGDIEITGAKDFLATTLENLELTATAETKIKANEVKLEGGSEIKIEAPEVKLGDATSLVLNENAVITDSVGGPCTISSAGQIKVKA